jgi:F0F1-type ATP synthase assembly protein I
MNRADDEGPSNRHPAGPKPRMKMGRAYQAAFEATIAVVVAGAAGGFADQRFGTAPMFLIAGVLLGFGTFVLRLVRLMNELAQRPQGADAPDEADEGGG